MLGTFRLPVLSRYFLIEMLGRSVTISLRRQSLIIQLSLGGKLVVVVVVGAKMTTVSQEASNA